MKKLKYTLILFFISSAINAQSLQNTLWKIYNSSLGDTILVDIRIDTILQYIKSDSILVSSLYWQYGDTIKLVDVGGTLGCSNPDTGYYLAIESSDSLYITLLSDLCIPRGVSYDGVVLKKVQLPTGLNMNAINIPELKVYPNPANGVVTISIGNPGELRIFTIQGQLVYHENIATSNYSKSINLRPGQYLVKVQSKSAVTTQKLLIN